MHSPHDCLLLYPLQVYPAVMTTSIHSAVKECNVEEVKRLVKEGVDPVARSQSGCTPLMVASWSGSASVVSTLLRLPVIREEINAFQEGGNHFN